MRAKWISIESDDALPRAEVERLLRKSYEQVVAKLPKKIQEQVTSSKTQVKSKSPEKRRKKR